MATKVKKNKINFKEKTVNIGIDMHKYPGESPLALKEIRFWP